VRADSHDDAHVADLLAPLADRVHRAVAIGNIGDLALPEHGQRFQSLCQSGGIFVVAEHLHDQVHLAPFRHKAKPVLRQAFECDVVEGVDAVARAIAHDSANAFRCVPILHRTRKIVVVVRVAAKRIHA
jgi:hypothetical protein